MYLYNNKKYYNYKIKTLEKAGIIRKFGWYYVIGSNGKKELEKLGYKYNRIQYNNKFIARQKVISHIAARYYNHPYIKFIPSVDMKDKEILTITARRYIGELSINQTKYLAYNISEKHTKNYIQSLIYDIRKERVYNNFIIFVEDIGLINIKDFMFGKSKIYIIPKNKENIQKLEQLNKIDYQEIFNKIYKEKVYLSGHMFCEYYINQSHYIYTLPLIDTEKLSTIKYFILENQNVKVDILYSKNISLLQIDKIEGANYIPIDYSKYIKEEFNVYE